MYEKGWHVLRFYHTVVIGKKESKKVHSSFTLILIINILLCIIYDYFINNNKLIKYEKYCNSV